ncbi:hypothetical protein IFM89_012982 [Coptis chinensis]|uniref:Uncharacterized protein n=1 Tax=Coptis chinensis TaxID=261450 RepID=A0A835IWH7_9MAGN|nr:hypothetical protein IFM89_012982 [Coptis chinensis]
MSGAASKVGDWAFKAFTGGLGVVTIYLTATFSVNVYRGLSWHNAQQYNISAASSSSVISFSGDMKYISAALVAPDSDLSLQCFLFQKLGEGESQHQSR